MKTATKKQFARVRKDLLGKGSEFMPLAGHYRISTNQLFEYRDFEAIGFQIKIKGKWELAQSIDFEFPTQEELDAEEKEYKVIWEIDIPATNPREAAEKALKSVQRPDTTANIFIVKDSQGHSEEIDLMALKHAETIQGFINEYKLLIPEGISSDELDDYIESMYPQLWHEFISEKEEISTQEDGTNALMLNQLQHLLRWMKAKGFASAGHAIYDETENIINKATGNA